MNQKIDFLGTLIDNVSLKETLSFIDNAISSNKKIVREDINAAKIVWMTQDPSFKKMIHKADLINADGQSIVLASKLLRNPLKERVSGIDLMEALVKLSASKDWTIFFLGAKEEIVSETVNFYTRQYSKKIITGYHHGYFRQNEEEAIVNMINQSNANILFIGMPSPQKELFIDTYKNILNANLLMGVGGSFDVISGKITRAPKWMQKYALEWLYRLYQEPKKMWKRYLYTNTLFIWLVLKKIFSS